MDELYVQTPKYVMSINHWIRHLVWIPNSIKRNLGFESLKSINKLYGYIRFTEVIYISITDWRLDVGTQRGFK